MEIDAPAVAGAGVLTLPSGVGTLLTAEGGKVLQVVRATDTLDRSTTSTSYVDASISVSITPQRSTSAILAIWQVVIQASAISTTEIQITDSANNPFNGAKAGRFTHHANGYAGTLTLIGYATPGTTSAFTIKGRFLNNNGSTSTLQNAAYNTGQLYAIEVSA